MEAFTRSLGEYRARNCRQSWPEILPRCRDNSRHFPSFHSSLQSQWIDTVRISRQSRWTILYEYSKRLRVITVLVDLEHDTNYDVSQLLNYFTKLYSIASNLPNDRQVSIKQRGSETDQSRRAKSYILIVKLRILAMGLKGWNRQISFRSM